MAVSSSQAGHAESVGPQRSDFSLAADRQAKSQHSSRLPGIDEAIIPEPRGGEECRRLTVELRDDTLLHRREFGPIDRLALTLLALFGDDREHFRRLLAAHDGDAVVGPGEDEARIIGAAAHAVIAGAEARADMQGELRHRRIRHRLDHLRAMLDDAAPLRLGADHVARRVLEIDDRRAGLAHELDELPGLGRAISVDRPVIADEAAGMPLDLSLAAHGVDTEMLLEVEKVGAIDEARDDFA